MLGDAGEHYALSQFTFAGKPATKMPDTWPGYDLVVETGSDLVKVSVKTRSESAGWKTSKWFMFDDRQTCHWLVLVFRSGAGVTRAWVIPFLIALEHANVPGPTRKEPHVREISWTKLNKAPLEAYENNWSLLAEPSSQLTRA